MIDHKNPGEGQRLNIQTLQCAAACFPAAPSATIGTAPLMHPSIYPSRAEPHLTVLTVSFAVFTAREGLRRNPLSF
jgi:hypothetical protein